MQISRNCSTTTKYSNVMQKVTQSNSARPCPYSPSSHPATASLSDSSLQPRGKRGMLGEIHVSSAYLQHSICCAKKYSRYNTTVDLAAHSEQVYEEFRLFRTMLPVPGNSIQGPENFSGQFGLCKDARTSFFPSISARIGRSLSSFSAWKEFGVLAKVRHD